MSEISLVSDMKEILTECQLCHKQFDEASRVPRRMPCCVEPVCEPCLLPLCNNGRLTCPFCHKLHTGYKGVQSLPVEQLILRLLSQTGKAPNPACTYCPQNNFAIAKCGHCSVLMCPMCLRAHTRNKLLKGHRVVMFEEIRFHRSNGPGSLSRTLSVTSINLLSQMIQKRESLKLAQKDLEEIQKNIALSRRRATEDINKYFEDLAREMRQRRSALLAQVEARAHEDSAEVARAIDSHRSMDARIKSFTTSSRTRKSLSSADTWELLSQHPDTVDYTRKAVSFVPRNGEQLASVIRATGLVRSVTFAPAEKPEGVPEAVMFNSILMDPAEDSDVNDGESGFVSHSCESDEQTCNLGDQLVNVDSGSSPLICPYLFWDTSTASKTITTTEAILTNAKPEVPLPKTGCRIMAERRAMTARSIYLRHGQRALFQLKISFSLKMMMQQNKMLFEAALTDSPVESSWNQPSGLSVNIASCSLHDRKLCLRLVHNNQLLEDIPLAQNEAGMSRGLHIGFLLNSVKNEIHVLNVEEVKVIGTLKEDDVDRPLWLMTLLSWPSWANTAVALVSGTKVRISKNMNKLLASLE